MSLNIWLRKLQKFSRGHQLRRRNLKRPNASVSARTVPAETLEDRASWPPASSSIGVIVFQAGLSQQRSEDFAMSLTTWLMTLGMFSDRN